MKILDTSLVFYSRKREEREKEREREREENNKSSLPDLRKQGARKIRCDRTSD